MSAADRIVVVIPCLNEARSIAALVRAVRAWIPTVLVVDDGSSDDTSAQAEAAGAQVLRHPRSLGKGTALRAGWDWARSRGYGWALCMDGDGQHAPADIPRFLAAAETGAAPLIIGNRMGQADKMPPLRRGTNRLMSAILSLLSGRRLPDTQCGYRLVSLEALEELQLSSTHFEIESEMLLAFAEAGLAVDFVPVAVIYREERSKIQPWRDTWRWIRWVLRHRSRSRAGRPRRGGWA